MPPIQSASRTRTEQERRYTASEQEALAVMFTLKKLLVYLLSNKLFVVYTDHQALQTVFKTKGVHRSLAKWMDLMAEHDFEIKYRTLVEEFEASRGDNVTKGLLATILWDDPMLSRLEPDFQDAARFMVGERFQETDSKKKITIRRKAKKFMI